jgi:small subunit ribosomal protein S16
MVIIRLARGGRKKMPVYTIVAADSREARDGRFLEKLGQYNPNTEPVLNSVKTDAIKAWVSKGAQVSPTVKSLLKRQGVALA